MSGEIIFLSVDEWEARARREGWWREVGLEEELGEFEPEHPKLNGEPPLTDEDLIRFPR